MIRPFAALVAVVLMVLVLGCARTLTSAPLTETAAFVTTLGNDTVAVERYRHTRQGMEATVALRAPRTTLATYRLALDTAGGLQSYEAVVRQPLTGVVLRRHTAEPVGDSLRFTRSERMGETATRTVAARSSLCRSSTWSTGRSS